MVTWGAFCACEDELFTCMYCKVYTLHSFLALNSSHIIWTFNFVHIGLDANSHNSEFGWEATWLRCILCMWGLNFACTAECTLFYSFLALNFSHICEPSNLFTLVLIPISHNSEFRWVATWLRCILYTWGWAFHMYSKVYTFHSFLALNSSHIICEPSILWSSTIKSTWHHANL